MREAVKRLTAGILSVCLSGLIPLSTGADDFKTLKFDLGNKGTASGYIGVKAEDKYTKEKGYGFQNPDAVENVDAGGKGALSDAVRFKSTSGHVFNVDIPSGVYKITVVTGDVKSAIITAEERKQLYFLTGTNAKDSFTIPVTDGQLNIYTSSGSGDNYSLSTIEIERAESKPTIWIYGDATVSNRYNVPDSLAQGWGQYLGKHVDTKKYDIRNLAITGFTSVDLAAHESFELSEYYGKTGDILILSLGVNDYLDENISESLYKKTMTGLVNRAKKKGMKVYLVKQHGQHSDMAKYPLPEYKWYGAALEELADSLQVGLIDLYRPFLELDLSNVFYDQKEYYTDDGFHLNALGCDTIAKMVSEQLFPVKKSVEPVKESADDESLTTTIYETEVSGQPISNPHKGYVMTTYAPHYIDSTKGYQYGINGPLKNRAWDCCTIVNGAIKWCELNPGKGKYNWALIDDMLEKCEEYGLTYVIRLVPYSTYNEKDYVPQWIYDEGAKKQTVRRVDKDEDITFPVWDDPVYLQACRDIATALAERYDGDPRVEFVDVSVFGDYGEWHNTFAEGDYMPSLEEQKKMLDHFASVFKKTLLAIPSGGWGEIYQYALSLGITKRDNGLICSPNIEWCLVPTYKANMPVIGENLYPYSMMKGFRPVRRDEYDYVSWSPKRFEETIEISHLSIYAFDQDSHCSYEFYNEHKDLIDKMCNRLGYNYTVTSAKRNGNKLKIKIKNTGLAPSFFNIDLCAEITDAKGNKKGLFGEPVKIKKGTFKDGSEQAFEFEYDGTLKEGEEICLAMYDCDNSLVKGKDPTVRFDNKNNLSSKRLKLVVKEVIEAKKNTPVPTETPENTVAPLPTLPPAEVEETPVLKPEPKITVTQDYDEETTDPAATATVTPAPAPGNAAVVEVDGNKVKVSGDGAEVVEAADKADVTIPSEVSEDGKVYKVTSISDKAFAGNLKITKIHIGDNITRIGDKAFLNCNNLKTVTGGKSVEVIGKAAFKNCKNLKSVTIGPKVKSIGKDAYRGCKKLKKVIVKTKLLKKKKVGSNAFKGIAKKAVFKIPKKKAKSYKTIFRNVSKGTKIKFQLKK